MLLLYHNLFYYFLFAMMERYNELKKNSKDCTFTTITTEQWHAELVRDAFVKGILSVNIRQRLLQNENLTLQQFYNQAQRNADSFIPQGIVTAMIEGSPSISAISTRGLFWYTRNFGFDEANLSFYAGSNTHLFVMPSKRR